MPGPLLTEPLGYPNFIRLKADARAAYPTPRPLPRWPRTAALHGISGGALYAPDRCNRQGRAGANGGPTDLDNLAPTCEDHHWCLHEGGWDLVGSATPRARARC